MSSSTGLGSAVIAGVLALTLALPNVAVAAPPADEDAAGDAAEPAEPRPTTGIGGAYGETVDYDWDGSEAPPPPSTGPRVDIEVQNGIRPVYLQRLGGAEPVEVCEAPCGLQIGDGSGQFILAGPGRRESKPFSLGSGDSYRLVARGGNPKLKTLGIALFPIAGAIAIGLIIIPTQRNMPFGAGVGFWATAGVIAAAGAGTGLVLIRFSRTQVKILPGG